MVKETTKTSHSYPIIRFEKICFLVGLSMVSSMGGFVVNISKHSVCLPHTTNQGINLVETCQGEHPNAFLKYALSIFNFQQISILKYL